VSLDPRVDLLVDSVARLEDKMDDVRGVLSRNTEILARNTGDVEKHIKRTELLEKSFDHLSATQVAVKIFAGLCAGIVGLGTLIQFLLRGP